MENATKALLITATILIAIILIALGVKLFSSQKDISKKASGVSTMVGDGTSSAKELLSKNLDIISGGNGSKISEVDSIEANKGNIDITNGSVQIFPDYYIQDDKKITYGGKSFIISGTTTTNTVEIRGDKTNTYNVCINGLLIDVSSVENQCAFNINEGANVNLKLIGTNTLKSGNKRAGLQKTSRDGNLIIDGTGKLNVYRRSSCCRNWWRSKHQYIILY